MFSKYILIINMLYTYSQNVFFINLERLLEHNYERIIGYRLIFRYLQNTIFSILTWQTANLGGNFTIS